MKYTIQITKEFQEDLKLLKEDEPKAYQKVLDFIDELEIHPSTGTSHPERLKHYTNETWSRQISKKHRLVYEKSTTTRFSLYCFLLTGITTTNKKQKPPFFGGVLLFNCQLFSPLNPSNLTMDN